MPTISLDWRINGVLSNAFSVKFGDERVPPVGTFGVRRTDTMQELVASGVSLSNPSTGHYEYVVSEPAAGLIYEYWLSIVDEDGEPPTVIHDYVAGASGVGAMKVLRFVAIKTGSLVVLSTPAQLSSPAGTYGVKRADDGTTVVGDATAYTHVGGGYYTYAFSSPAEDDIYRYYVEAVIDGVTYHLPRTTALISSAALAIGRYTDSHRVDTMFGVESVHKWCSIDEHDDAVDYARRLYDQIAAADAEIDDVLRGSPVAVPITAAVPSIVTEIATQLAGVRMYESRGVIDFDLETGQPQHRLQYHKKEAWRRLAMLKAGQLRLDGETVTRHPVVGSDDDE